MTALKKMLAAGVSLAALVSLAACGGGASGSKAEAQEVTLTVWTPQEDQVDSNSWLPQVEADFEKAHPEYKITWKNSVVSEADAATTVKQDPSSAADVYMFANDQLGTLIESKAIAELSDDALTQVKEQNNDVMIQSVTGEDGKVYGVPYTGNTWFLYYNKSKFSADDVKSLDTMLSKGKVAFQLSNSWFLPSFYVADGATIFGADGIDASAGVQLSSNAPAITNYLIDLKNNPNFVNDADGAGLAGISNGTVDAYFSGSWDAANVKKALGDNYAAALPPTYTLNGKALQLKTFAGSKAIAYNPNSKNIVAAAQFAAFMGSKDAQKKHYELRQIIPSDSSLASDSSIAEDPVATAQIATIDHASINQPTIPAMNDFWSPCESFGKGILSGEVTKDNAAQKTADWQAAYKK